MRILCAQALEDLVDAVGEVKALQERTIEADRNAQVDVSVQVTFANHSLLVTRLLTVSRHLFGAVAHMLPLSPHPSPPPSVAPTWISAPPPPLPSASCRTSISSCTSPPLPSPSSIACCHGAIRATMWQRLHNMRPCTLIAVSKQSCKAETVQLGWRLVCESTNAHAVSTLYK